MRRGYQHLTTPLSSKTHHPRPACATDALRLSGQQIRSPPLATAGARSSSPPVTRDAPAASASGGSSLLSLTPPNPTSEPTLSPPAPGTLASEDQSYRTKAGERTTNPHGHEGFTTAPSPGMVSSQPWSQETNQELPPPFPASTGGTTGMAGPRDSPVPTADRATTEVHGPRLQEETTPAQQRSSHHVRFTTPTPETPSLDESLEYCIGNVLLFWKPPSVFSNWSPSNFTVEGVRYSSMEQFIMAEKCKLFGDLATRERILGVSDPRLQKRWGRAAKHFNEGVWKANRKYITLVGLYEKFLQNSAMCQHLLSTGDRLLAEASPRHRLGHRSSSRRPRCRDSINVAWRKLAGLSPATSSHAFSRGDTTKNTGCIKTGQSCKP